MKPLKLECTVCARQTVVYVFRPFPLSISDLVYAAEGIGWRVIINKAQTKTLTCCSRECEKQQGFREDREPENAPNNPRITMAGPVEPIPLDDPVGRINSGGSASSSGAWWYRRHAEERAKGYRWPPPVYPSSSSS